MVQPLVSIFLFGSKAVAELFGEGGSHCRGCDSSLSFDRPRKLLTIEYYGGVLLGGPLEHLHDWYGDLAVLNILQL